MKEILFNVLFGKSNATVISLSNEKSIFELKVNVSVALDVEFGDVCLILEKYGVLDTEDTCDLELNMLGLEDDKYYNLFVLNITNPQYDWKIFCSEKIIGKVPITQIGFVSGGKKNTPICYACETICRANEETTEIILENNFFCQCSDNKDGKCFFKGCENSYPEEKQSKFQNINSILKHHAQSLFKREKDKIDAVNAKILARRFDFEKSAKFGLQRVTMYDEENVKQKILSVVPIAELEKETENKIISKISNLHYRDELVRSLLFWFKKKFYSWCDKAVCSVCTKPSDIYIEIQTPSLDEQVWLASRTEVYKCSCCNTLNRFPRYNNPAKLCDTRTGRCGEWANLFGCILKCFKYDVRFIDNFEDHVWNEYWSESLNRWVHVDSCENAWDTPLIYEQGWGRNLTFILAFSTTGVYDVTRRYVKDWNLVASRRSQEEMEKLNKELGVRNNLLRENLPSEMIEYLHVRDLNEQMELLKVRSLKEAELVGRDSGSEEWRKQRGEIK